MARKKPPLTLVTSSPFAAGPPATLGATGATLWQSLMSEHRIEDAASLETLLQICTAADSAASYAAIIAQDGPVILTKQGPKDHPLLRHELAARSFVVRALQRLNLEPPRPVGRPNVGFGWVPPRHDP